MRNILTVILLVITLTSCSALDLVKGLTGSGPSLDAELVIGDKSEDLTVDTKIGETNTTNNAEVINNEVTNNTDYVMLGLFVLSLFLGAIGWILPQPKWMRQK